MEDDIWMLVTKKIANEATEKELKELDSLLNQNPIARNSLKLLFDWWDNEDLPEEDNTHLQFKKILERISDK
jgi:putative ABC transport system permease protein